MRRLLWSSVMVLVCSVAPVLGQTTSGGSVRGVVRDEQGAALRGAAITATSATAPETYTTASDAEGHYQLTNLPPGDYKIVVVLEGFTTLVREPIVVRAGKNVGLDLDLKVGGVADTVEVSGDTPLLERTLPSQAVNIDGEFQRSLPLSPRAHWTDFLMLTPGVASQNLGSHLMLYFTHGSGFDSQVALVDGAEVNPASQNYPGLANFSTEALADVQVTTVGATASTPLGAGGVLNAVTKSGTNTFSGSASLTWQDMRWNANNRPGGTSTWSAIVQPDVAVGGPIRRDRAWFFASYRHNHYREGLDRTPTQLAALTALSPGFRPFDRKNVSNYYFAKGSALVAANHRLQGFYKYDRNPIEGPSADSAATFASSVSGGHTGSVQLNSLIGRKVLLRAAATINRLGTSTDVVRLDAPRRIVFQSTTLVSGRSRGVAQLAVLDNVASFIEGPGQRSVASVDLTLFDPAGLRGHELSAGVYWQALELDRRTRYVNGGFAAEDLVLRNPNDLNSGAVAFHRQIFDGDNAVTQDAEAQDLAVYVQDVWRIGAAATLTAGVRVDHIRQRDNLFGVRTEQSTDIGPRVGVNVTVPGDGKALVHATWARRHEGVSGTIVSAGSNAIGFRDVYDLNLDGIFETTFVTPPATVLFPDRLFDPERHQPFVDDIAVGYQRQIGGSTTIDATYVHRAFKDRVALVESNGIYADDVFSGFRNPELNEIYLVTNNRWNGQIYDALEVRASRATASLQLIASYTRQWRRLDGTWQPNDPAAIVQPDAFANERGIGYTRGFSTPSEANSLSGTSMVQFIGPASQWRDHVANLGVSYQAPWQLILSSNYSFASGPWSGPVVTRLAAPDPAFGPPVVTLPTGRIVSNPLATTFRFPGNDRSEGQFVLPDLHVWSVRVGKTMTVHGAKVEASVNVQNVLNGDADQLLAPGGNQLFSPLYRTFVSRQAPRSGQVLLRVRF